jgi:hypothetical protein
LDGSYGSCNNHEGENGGAVIEAGTKASSLQLFSLLLRSSQFNQLPEPTNSTIIVTVEEDKAVSHALSFVDFDSPVVTIVADNLPTNGVLTYATNSETKQLSLFNQYNPYGGDIPKEQYATGLVSYSSHWYNADGDWAADKILGEPSTTVYTDTPLSWCPESKTGTGISRNDNDEVGREVYWDRDSTFAEEGYTEYIEVEFDTPVYASEIEIGENRGCGSIVHILAKNSETGLSMSVLQRRKADETCDREDGRARQTKFISPFTAPKFCNTPFLVREGVCTRHSSPTLATLHLFLTNCSLCSSLRSSHRRPTEFALSLTPGQSPIGTSSIT